MSDGWVKLHRRLTDSDLMQNAPALCVFVYLLITAQHRPCKRSVGSCVWNLDRGQVYITRSKLCEALNLSPQKIRTAIKYLEDTERITSETTNHGTRVTVCNWNTYQHESGEDNQQNNQQPTSSQPTGNQQPTSLNNVNKNERMENGEIPPDPEQEKIKQTAKEIHAVDWPGSRAVLLDIISAVGVRWPDIKGKAENIRLWAEHYRGDDYKGAKARFIPGLIAFIKNQSKWVDPPPKSAKQTEDEKLLADVKSGAKHYDLTPDHLKHLHPKHGEQA